MGRPPNQLPTVNLTVSTTPQVEQHLQTLVDTGFYGKNTAEAAERLVASSIKAMLSSGELSSVKRKKV